MLEVLHHRRSLQLSLGAFVLYTLVHHLHVHHLLALPCVLYPPAQHLGLRPLAYRLESYYYVLRPHVLRSRELHPGGFHTHVLHPCGLYLLVRSPAFDTHAPPIALHALGHSLEPRAYGLPPLASPLGLLFVLYPVVVCALVPDYFHLWVLKHPLQYHLSGLRPLNSCALVLQAHFDRHLLLHIRALREMAVQDLPVLLDLVFVAPPYLARLALGLSLPHPAHSPIFLAPRSFALVFASIYPFLTPYGVSLVCAAR